VGLHEDYFGISMDGIPEAWYRGVPAATQRRIMDLNPRLRIVRRLAPPKWHICICQHGRLKVMTTEGTLRGWFSIEDRIKGGLDGLEAFMQSAAKNYREWEKRGGEDTDKQWRAHEQDQADMDEKKRVTQSAKYDAIEEDFGNLVVAQKTLTGPGMHDSANRVRKEDLVLTPASLAKRGHKKDERVTVIHNLRGDD